MKNNHLTMTALIALFCASACCNHSDKPENVIYLIGDGMGFGAVTTLLYTEDEVTGFEMASAIGLSETSSADNYTTDSAAGGTALATGTRTKNGYAGADPDGNQLTSIMKKAQAMGKKSGIVVNTTLTEATPSAFYAGVTSRYEVYDIAKQFTESGVDVAIGSGLEHFISRPDSLDLTAVLIEKGYDVYLNWEAVLKTSSDRFIGILPPSDVHRRNADNDTETASVYLEKATAKALDVLARDSKDGFFLMIESAVIDGYGHNNDSEGMIAEMKEFNRTLKQLIAYVDEHPNTLLIVTADHETGGTGISYSGYGAYPKHVFSTRGHTGNVVPIFAYGPGAENFSGVMKNTDIPKKIEELIR